MERSRDTPRYIQSSRTQNILTNLNLSRFEPTRENLSNSSHNSFATNDNPFNPEILTDVNYTDMKESSLINSRRHIASKFNNHNPGNNNIALYDTRIFTKNAENFIPGEMQRNLMNRAKSKITMNNTDMMPKNNNYNPNLPTSETNTYNAKPTLLDDRIIESNAFINRDFNYASDRANAAYDLQRSDYMKEKLQRQVESDKLFNHHSQIKRYDETKQTYKNQYKDELYKLSDEELKNINKNNDRNTLTEKDLQESFITSRNEFNANDINNLHNDVYGNFINDYARDMRTNFELDTINSRIEQFRDNIRPKGILVESFDYITRTIENFLGWNKKDNVNDITVNQELLTRSSYGDENYKTFDQSLMSSLQPFMSDYYNRFRVEPDHVLILNNKQVRDVYEDDDFSNTALSAVTMDEFNTGLTRSMAVVDNDKLVYIQKIKNDSLFDNEDEDDDYVVVELPVEKLDINIRSKLRKYNTSTNRDKIVELSYDDFIIMNDYINQHPELKKRYNREQLHARVRMSDYDKGIVDGYESDSMFVDNKVYNNLKDNSRRRIELHQKGRVNKDIEETIDDVNPKRKINVQSNKTIVMSHTTDVNRRNGLKRGAFD